MSIKRELKKANIIVKKRVKLTSGKTADFYCDFKKVYENPKVLKKVADALVLKIKEKSIRRTQGLPTCIAATGFGGIPLATLVSTKLNLPLVLVRTEKRNHGLKKTIEGYIPTVKDSVAIVEDVCTYSTSLMKIISSSLGRALS